MKKKLILVASPPACGKTYVSEKIAKNVENIVYLDKDDLCDIVRAGFAVAGQELDMDGEFYIENIRPAEYATILHIAFSTLRFADKVMLCAPFGKEVRDEKIIHELKNRANNMGAELLMIWVTAPIEVCRERMTKRNSDRDTLKLENWESYASKINYNAPTQLKESGAVDKFLIFDTADDTAFQKSFGDAMAVILED